MVRSIALLVLLFFCLPWSGSSTPPGHTKSVTCVAFSPDGRTLASSSDDQTIRFWDPSNGQLQWSVVNPDKTVVQEITFSPDSRTLAADCFNRVITWDAKLRRQVLSVGGGGSTSVGLSDQAPNSVAYTPDGKLLATGQNNSIYLWSAKTGKLETRLKWPLMYVTCVRISPDGRYLAASCRDKQVRVWSLSTGRLLVELAHDSYVNTLVFSPNSRLLATAGLDNAINLWDIPGRKGLRAWREAKKGKSVIHTIAFSPDGRRVASHGSGEVWITDVTTGERSLTLKHGGGRNYVNWLAYSPDGTTLAVACGDATISLWDLRTAKLKYRIGTSIYPP